MNGCYQRAAPGGSGSAKNCAGPRPPIRYDPGIRFSGGRAVWYALAFALLARAADGPALPAPWHGTWRGTLTVTGPDDKPAAVPMALQIGPVPGTRDVTWAITYGEGAKAVVRGYVLQPDGDTPGRFKIDEKNGIVLAARLVDGVLYSPFAVGGAHLTARYELHGDVLRFEITSAKPAPAKTGDGKVQGFTVEVVQRADLKRK